MLDKAASKGAQLDKAASKGAQLGGAAVAVVQIEYSKLVRACRREAGPPRRLRTGGLHSFITKRRPVATPVNRAACIYPLHRKAAAWKLASNGSFEASVHAMQGSARSIDC